MDRVVNIPICIFAERNRDNINLHWRSDGDLASDAFFTFSSPHREVFKLIFTIEPNGVALQFPENPLDAFWVGRDAPPTERSNERDYEPLCVSEDGKRLEVLNINRAPARYFFAINFESSLGPVRLVSDG